MSGKADNRAAAWDAKVDLRRRVMEKVAPARVLDCFCGNGAMHKAAWGAWGQLERWIGIDERYEWPEGSRYVGDNRRVLRAIDLSEFNVFDLDAYGSPWEQALIIARRRSWEPGERGALVVTDGASKKTRFGQLPHAMAQLLGVPTDASPPGNGDSEWLHRTALRRWTTHAGVTAIHQWEAVSKSSGVGAQEMRYSALVFEGRAS